MIIGAAKAGTTSLHAILERHPRIFMPSNKEPEFFARDEKYQQGVNSYCEIFKNARPDQLVGEASTIYSLSPFFPETARRIASHVPGAKLIYIMREPVSRAYSYYVQIVKNYQNVTKDFAVHRTFEDFVIPDCHARAAPRHLVFSESNSHLPDVPDLCLAGSDYVMQIEAYLKHFDRSQILFLLFEEFANNPSAVIRKITDFLGVEALSEDILRDETLVRNVSRKHFEDLVVAQNVSRTRSRLGALWFARRILPKGIRASLKKNLFAGTETEEGSAPRPMEPETRQRLNDFYRPCLHRLEELTGLDFSCWEDLAPTRGAYPSTSA